MYWGFNTTTDKAVEDDEEEVPAAVKTKPNPSIQNFSSSHLPVSKPVPSNPEYNSYNSTEKDDKTIHTVLMDNKHKIPFPPQSPTIFLDKSDERVKVFNCCTI